MQNTRYDHDYFISYAGGDVAWAEWVAWALEIVGYNVFHQKLDIQAGHDLVKKMNIALASSERIIPIYSPLYLTSNYTKKDLSPFQWDDASGKKRRIMPIVVEPYPGKNSLRPIPAIDFVGITDKEHARQRLLNVIGNQGTRESTTTKSEPPFPGNRPNIVEKLPSRNPAALTFEAEIDQTQKFMQADHVAVIQPPASSGRQMGNEANTIATEYAYRYQSQYNVIIQGDASNDNALKQAQKDILRLLNPTNTSMIDTLKVIEQVKQTLSRQKDWLLIFSNVYDPFPPSIYDLLAIARSGSGHLLITTQQLSQTGINSIINVHKRNEEEENLVQYLIQMRDAKLRSPINKKVWRLGPQGVKIGRTPENDIQLSDADSVSSQHATVRLGEGGYKIMDLQSTNKTFINESSIPPNHPYPLFHKDAIKLGLATLIYEIGEIVCTHCDYPHDPNTTTCPQTNMPVEFSQFIKAPEEGFILCPFCREEHPENTKYCRARGKQLPSKKQLLLEADEFYNNQEYQKAQDIYEQVIQLNRKLIDAHRGKGKTFYKLGQYDKAFHAFEQALRLQPDDKESLSWQGETWYQRRYYKEALEVFYALIRIEPDNAKLYRWIGRTHDKLKQYEKALIAFNSALSINKNHADTHNRRGNTLYNLKKYPEALLAYDKAIELESKKATPLESKQATAYNGRGHTLAHLHSYPDALEAFKTALRLNPDLIEAHLGKGNVLLDLDKPEDALTTFERALQIDADYSDLGSIYCGKYKALLSLGRVSEAQIALKEAARRGEVCS